VCILVNVHLSQLLLSGSGVVSTLFQQEELHQQWCLSVLLDLHQLNSDERTVLFGN
jgi:hypothetical protein